MPRSVAVVPAVVLQHLVAGNAHRPGDKGLGRVVMVESLGDAEVLFKRWMVKCHEVLCGLS